MIKEKQLRKKTWNVKGRVCFNFLFLLFLKGVVFMIELQQLKLKSLEKKEKIYFLKRREI